MTERWAACFPRSSLPSALPLRIRGDVKACDADELIWLTGTASFEEIDPLLQRIPDIVRYSVQLDDTLTRLGRRIPECELPRSNWTTFAALAEFQPQPAALPATPPAKIRIQIVRSAQSLEPSAILCPLQRWVDYAITAPEVRLKPLRFAVHHNGQTLILGSPLPPLRGQYLVNHGGLLLASGYRWEPPVEPPILRRAMNLSDHDFALLNPDGGCEVIPAENRVAASRSAARRSLAAMTETAGAT